MHAGFRTQKSIGVLTADLEHGTLDSGLFALAYVEDLDGVATSFGPTGVHAHEHLRPILRLGSTRSGADLQLRVAKIVRATEQRPKLEPGDLTLDGAKLLVEISRHRLVRFTCEQLIQLDSSRDPSGETIVRFDPAFQLLHLLNTSAGAFL